MSGDAGPEIQRKEKKSGTGRKAEKWRRKETSCGENRFRSEKLRNLICYNWITLFHSGPGQEQRQSKIKDPGPLRENINTEKAGGKRDVL